MSVSRDEQEPSQQRTAHLQALRQTGGGTFQELKRGLSGHRGVWQEMGVRSGRQVMWVFTGHVRDF